MRASWPQVKVERVVNGTEKTPVGQSIPIQVIVRLGAPLTPEDVAVQVYAGPVDADRRLVQGDVVALTCDGPADGGGDGVYTYSGALPSRRSGQHGFAVRVVPAHADAVLPQEMSMVTWE